MEASFFPSDTAWRAERDAGCEADHNGVSGGAEAPPLPAPHAASARATNVTARALNFVELRFLDMNPPTAWGFAELYRFDMKKL